MELRRIMLPITCNDTIAVGAELNNVVCVARKSECFMSKHIGETSNLESLNRRRAAVEALIKENHLKPELIACDLHPEYNSTALADELAKKYNARLVQIQHHKAHVAGVAAEHGLSDYVGIAMDGLGYGEDGNIWGGEVFDVTQNCNFKRIGHLEEQPQLGGDSAAIYPKKMLFGILTGFLDKQELLKIGLFDEKESLLYLKQLKAGFNVPYTTSAGRVLDAVSALLGFCEKRTYDGEPAITLEKNATQPLKLEPVFAEKKGRNVLMTTPLFKFILKNIDKEERGRLAATAQTYLARGMLEIAKERAENRNTGKEKKPIVFSGGVANNKMISSFMKKNSVLLNKKISCGDAGICYGQAYLANVQNRRI